MPKNQVSDLITDQEMTFARLVLSGAKTDREAAIAAGLHPSTAAYTKTRPRVRAYMLAHRAAVEQQLIQQETEAQGKQKLGREQILARLWEIANLSPEMTRGSATSQVKALSIIVALEGLIPDRRTAAESKSVPPPAVAPFYQAAGRSEPEEKTFNPSPTIPFAQHEDKPVSAGPEPKSSAGSAPGAPPLTVSVAGSGKPGFANWPLTS